MPFLPDRAGSTTGRPRRALVAIAWALAFAWGPACGAPADHEIDALRARDVAAADPHRGVALLRALREQAKARQHAQVRLSLDEALCRVLTDLDAAQALAAADAGLEASGGTPTEAAREAWLRLRACRAGMLLELGRLPEGQAELERLFEATARPADAGVHALVQLERGVHRSRSGQLELAQTDLLRACETLRSTGPSRDLILCLGHLANHYRRVGDADEALKMLVPLRDQARQRGETYDDAIYTFGIAQVQQQLKHWDEATEAYRQSSAANELLHDDVGLGFAQHGLATTLLHAGRADEALAHVERSLALTPQATVPRQFELATVTRADALTALGRAEQALALLDSIGDAVRRRHELDAMLHWWKVRAQALRALGRWQEGYQALSEALAVDQALQAQRLSGQSARLRMQFNRARDAEELANLRKLNEQGRRLREAQAVALAMFVILLAILAAVAWRALHRSHGLRRLASTDELTGLLNRRSLFEFAGQALRQARADRTPLAVLMIDIDHFKPINDTHGHAVGDQVLRHVATMLGASLRAQDRLGRVGGEEFVVVLPGSSLADAAQVAERMRSAVASVPAHAGAEAVPVTVSLGVAAAEGIESAEALVALADAALYRAKQGGRNRVVVSD